jgi:diguanylate cyclase (GGDEF)-like protein
MLANHRIEKLSATVGDLVKKAAHNEQVLQRYQHFELQLLDAADFDALLNVLLVKSLQHFQLDAVELWLYDPQQTLQQLLAQRQPNGLSLLSRIEELTGLYGAKPGVRMASLLDMKTQPVFAGLKLRSAALLPLVRHGMLVGSLHFGAKGHERFSDDKSTDFIAHLASVVAVCLENAVNQERLRRLSMYDMLTQVKNRRAFKQALASEVSRAVRSQEPLSVLLLDLDFFKRINDSYGHPTGDRVLKAVAQHIEQLQRKTDHLCRYGGEEFALVLPNCNQARALEIAERIRQQVKALRIASDNQQSVALTLSIGVTCWQPSIDAPSCSEQQQQLADALVLCADRAVYVSKESGRDRVSYHNFTV